MPRKRIFGWMLGVVTFFVVYKYFPADFTPPVYLHRLVNGRAPDVTTILSDSEKRCQLERPLFMKREELPKFTISHPAKYKPHRKMNEKERKSLVSLLELVQAYLERNKISYVLAYESLLGSYVMHTVLPYENTVHLLARTGFNKTVADSVAKDDKLAATWPNYTHLRFFEKKAGRQPPFVELHFFDENSTHVWTTAPPPRHVVMETSSFYPFHERPFASHWVPAPKDPRKFLLQIYSTKYYEFVMWNTTKSAIAWPMKVVWRVIRNSRPVVKRVNCGEGVKETLVCHGLDQYILYIDEAFPSKTVTLGLG